MNHPNENNPRVVAIIGAGFSGSLTAIHLAHSTSSSPLIIYLIDRRGSFGPGLAYSPPTDRFKLNVRAKAMGALPDDPEGFFRWLKERDPQASPEAFVSRTLYGKYLSELVENASTTPGNNAFHRIHDEATDLSYDASSNRFTVTLTKGEPVVADACVLAIGNLMKGSLDERRTSEIFRDPFSASSYSDISKLSSLLIVGSGLTAVDVIVEAEARGFHGNYTVVSRHGRLPLAHEAATLSPASLPPDWERLGSARKLLTIVRKESQRLSSSQPVIEAMRPHLQTMWRHLSAAERRRFIRHIRPFGEIHRHRIPREHASILEKLQATGRLTLLAGRVETPMREGEDISATITLRGQRSSPQRITTDAVFLCAGAEAQLERVHVPLVQNLVKRHLLTTGPLGIGAIIPPTMATAPKAPHLWLLGPLQREERWEITAVRELRVEARDVAQHVAKALSR